MIAENFSNLNPGNIINLTDTIDILYFKNIFSTGEELKYWFTENELGKFNLEKNANSLACRYVVKKMIINHLESGIHPCEIEILNNSMGKPQLTFSINIENILEELNIKRIHCSLSHSMKMAAAMVVIERKVP